jgi:hypothetical protein
MVDRYRASVQHRRSGFTNLFTPESDCAWIDEPAPLMVGVVRNLYPGSYTLHPRNLGIPTCQLPMGV